MLSTEHIINKLGNELSFIIDKTKSPKLDISVREHMAKSIIHSLRGQEVTSLFETNHGRLAKVLNQHPANYIEYRELVAAEIPTYKANPKALLSLGGFEWKTEFEIPVKLKRPRKPTQAALDAHIQETIILSELALKQLNNRITNLEDAIANIIAKSVSTSRSEALGSNIKSLIKRHIHLADKVLFVEAEDD